MPNQDATATVQNAFAQMGMTGLVVIGVVLLLVLVVWWRIFSKAGFSGALAFLMFIPLVNFVMLLILAFGEWPVRRELKALRSGNPVI